MIIKKKARVRKSISPEAAELRALLNLDSQKDFDYQHAGGGEQEAVQPVRAVRRKKVKSRGGWNASGDAEEYCC